MGVVLCSKSDWHNGNHFTWMCIKQRPPNGSLTCFFYQTRFFACLKHKTTMYVAARHPHQVGKFAVSSSYPLLPLFFIRKEMGSVQSKIKSHIELKLIDRVIEDAAVLLTRVCCSVMHGFCRSEITRHVAKWTRNLGENSMPCTTVIF